MMFKNKVLVLSVVLGFLLTYLVSARTVSAFWLFDLFRGRVKGEETTRIQNSIPDYVKSVVRRIRGGENNATPSATPTEKPEDQGEVSDEKMNQLGRTGRISEAQKAELLAKLNAIKAKRAELKALEMDLVTWLKNHRIETTATPSAKISPSLRPTLRVTLPVTPETNTER